MICFGYCVLYCVLFFVNVLLISNKLPVWIS